MARNRRYQQARGQKAATHWDGIILKRVSSWHKHNMIKARMCKATTAGDNQKITGSQPWDQLGELGKKPENLHCRLKKGQP